MAQGVVGASATKIPKRPALWALLFFLAFYYLTNAGWYKIGDEAVMSAVAKQIVQKGRIGIEQEQLPNIGPYQDDSVMGQDGAYYFKWGIGQSLIEAPFYFLHRLLTGLPLHPNIAISDFDTTMISELMMISLCPSLISALGCALVFLLGLRLGFSKATSLFVTLIYGLGTMAWPYSKSLMSEATQNVSLLGSVYGAVCYGLSPRRRFLLLSAACMGFAVITKVLLIVLSPFIVFYVLGVRRSRRSYYDLVICFVPVMLLFLGLQLWFNYVRYNSPWEFGYDQGFDALGFSTPLYVGLWGLWMSPGKSFFIYTPIAILGLACAGVFYRKRRWEALLFLAVIVGTTVPHAMWCSWSGDWSWGPRFLLLLTPYLIVPTGFFFGKWGAKSPLKKSVVVLLILISLGVQVLGVSIHPFSYVEARTEVIHRLVEIEEYSYKSLTIEDAIAHFSPLPSHVVGNWWLFKHMILSYDIWKDAPWNILGDFELPDLKWVKGNRVIPFWWPISFSLVSPEEKKRIGLLALANLLLVIWIGMRLAPIIRIRNEDSPQKA
ncbi:MAG: hypothetical protein JRJ31_05350 [Deltaproteobacteria bacterium]|nr:hypothetical protein [Deltaproteobacteria bacterium]